MAWAWRFGSLCNQACPACWMFSKESVAPVGFIFGEKLSIPRKQSMGAALGGCFATKYDSHMLDVQERVGSPCGFYLRRKIQHTSHRFCVPGLTLWPGDTPVSHSVGWQYLTSKDASASTILCPRSYTSTERYYYPFFISAHSLICGPEEESTSMWNI